MRKLLIGVAVAAGMGVAGLGMGVASATPGMVDCSNPCVNKAKIAAEAPAATGAPWTDFFANAPWEPFFDGTNGVQGDGKGAWESGVEAVNGGAWERAFPPAE